MPARKRARVSQASTPQPKPSAEATSPEAHTEKSKMLADPWTDDEESQLFKSVIKFKPTGVHKHFRMIAIQNQLASHGFTAPSIQHTKIPGIWAKLESLYDLEVLDERENNHMGILATPSETEQSDQEEEGDEEGEGEEDGDAEDPWKRRAFDMPDDDYQELAFSKRLDEDRPSSPEAIEGLSRTRNVLGDDELREKRQEYDKEDAISARGKGRKATAARATRTRGGRSTRSTPQGGGDDEEEAEEEEGSTVDESPQGKGTRKTASRTASTRRSRRR